MKQIIGKTNNLLWLSPKYSEVHCREEHHKHIHMLVPSVVIASGPPLWHASFYRLFSWQKPTKNQNNKMQNICILEFVSCYYAWYMSSL